MDLITYGYNMAFLLLFSAVLSSCSTTYGLTGRRIYRYFAWLMFAFLLESALSAAVNIWTSSTPDTLFSRGGLLCDILNAADAAVEIYLVGAILYALFPPRRKTGAYAAVAAVLLGTLGILPGAVGAFLWRSVYSLASAALCGMYFHRLRCERDPAARATALRGRRMVTVMLVFSLLAVGEAALYTRYPREVMGDIFALYDRVCFSEDLFSVILAVRLLLLSREEKVRHSAQQMEQLLQQRMNEFQAREAERLEAGPATADGGVLPGLRPHGAGDGDPPPDPGGKGQPGDQRGAADQDGHGEGPRPQHLHQAEHLPPQRAHEALPGLRSGGGSAGTRPGRPILSAAESGRDG